MIEHVENLLERIILSKHFVILSPRGTVQPHVLGISKHAESSNLRSDK